MIQNELIKNEIKTENEIIEIEMGKEHQIKMLLMSKDIGTHMHDEEGSLQAHESMGGILKEWKDIDLIKKTVHEKDNTIDAKDVCAFGLCLLKPKHRKIISFCKS